MRYTILTRWSMVLDVDMMHGRGYITRFLDGRASILVCKVAFDSRLR